MGRKDRNRNKQEDVAEQQEAPMIEAAPVEAAAEEPEVIQEHKVDFDGWYGARAPKIPGHHHKEIIRADFRGRKVPVMATMAEFDEALKKYGVRLA